ncbi:MAG: hypothetical protein JO113_04960 [Candidatus Eremiobacteraeota bacterium]|nr:hypothetical protein [Candidatus Eremiobacteraeota bacterium]
MNRAFILAALAGAAPAGCAGTPTAQGPAPFIPGAGPRAGRALFQVHATSKIQHVIVIVQENRTVDNLFQFLPGASTQSWGYNSYGQRVTLQPEELTAPYDPGHNHIRNWKAEYNYGQFNGFNLDSSSCRNERECPPPQQRAYAYVPMGEIQPYYTMAQTYTFGDNMFQTNQGPSFPAHQYLVSGTSTIYDRASEQAAENPGRQLGGCDSPRGTQVKLIDTRGFEREKAFPCFERSSIFTLLDQAGISWKYYQVKVGPGLWNGVDALKPIWQNKFEYAENVVEPPSQVLTDVFEGRLASVVFVTPTAAASDHGQITDGSGPSWVASVVNTVGYSPYWNTTAIIVTWDDWGGWFDHVVPTVRNPYELGFRVPLLVISPYAKAGYVSHVNYEFGSILKFIEKTFGLGSLGTTDKNANNLTDCFNFGAKPHHFKRIASPLSAHYFLALPPDNRSPDND